MEPKRTNPFRTALWSIVPLVFGILFAGLIVEALNQERTSDEVEIATPKKDGWLVSYIERLRTLGATARAGAGNAVRDLDFNAILYPPKAGYHLKDELLLPRVGAAAYVVGDVDTGEIIIEKNADSIYPIASVTKLMTALVSLEEVPQSDTGKISSRAIGTLGTSGQLVQGEKMKASDLLYPLLLVSSNDAGEALTEFLGRDRFISLMNTKASALGMAETNYEDASGLSANNYSTGADLLRLSTYLYKHHRTVFDITALDKYTLGRRTWTNANRFSKRDDYVGGKTGYTDKAKRTGVALFKISFDDYEERTIAVILLKTDNRTEDINNILSYLEDNVYLAYDEKLGSAGGTVSLGFVGDIMMDRGVKTSVYKNFDGDFGAIFEEARAIRSPDIMFGNLEGPISDKGKNVGSKYSFRFEPSVTPVLKDAGFDILSFANNHVGDWSDEAFLDTLGRLEEENILVTGAGESYAEAKKPVIIERSGVTIGFLGTSDVGPTWMAAGENKPGIILAGDKDLAEIISEAKRSVDVLVVSVHWGDEYKAHNARQSALGKKMIDAGADIVVGHHPHVAQAVEEYKEGVIFYSLGNFVFDQYFSPETMSGLFAEAVVDKDGLVSHRETNFTINDLYQPVLGTITAQTDDFKQGSCPSGNSEFDYTLFNANPENSIDKYIPESLVELGSAVAIKDNRTVCLVLEAAEALTAMYDAAVKDDATFSVTSGFRGYDAQAYLYEQGATVDENGNENIAKPGHSEHQLGTTVDLSSNEISNNSADIEFKKTKAYDWLLENAHDFGFVMSYPQDADTGYIYEPWHWRYIGIDEAKEIRRKGQTIQEYLENQ